MCSWWWVELPPETCRAVYTNVINCIKSHLVGQLLTLLHQHHIVFVVNQTTSDRSELLWCHHSCRSTSWRRKASEDLKKKVTHVCMRMFYAELYNLLGLISHAKTLFYIWLFFRSFMTALCHTWQFHPTRGWSQSFWLFNLTLTSYHKCQLYFFWDCLLLHKLTDWPNNQPTNQQTN
jgi:hypothetical protein